MEWEQIDGFHQRAKVFGGWLVKAHENVYHQAGQYNQEGMDWDWRVALAFVPDPNYEWKIES